MSVRRPALALERSVQCGIEDRWMSSYYHFSLDTLSGVDIDLASNRRVTLASRSMPSMNLARLLWRRVLSIAASQAEGG